MKRYSRTALILDGGISQPRELAPLEILKGAFIGKKVAIALGMDHLLEDAIRFVSKTVLFLE
ncbi:MAG: hypothetical protein WA902_21250 [Thermosynechococcaceae cyanobacterium]